MWDDNAIATEIVFNKQMQGELGHQRWSDEERDRHCLEETRLKRAGNGRVRWREGGRKRGRGRGREGGCRPGNCGAGCQLLRGGDERKNAKYGIVGQKGEGGGMGRVGHCSRRREGELYWLF